MKPQELAALVISWQVTHDDETFEQILDALFGTVRYFSRKFHARGWERDDFVARCHVAIWHACQDWDPNRSTIRPYIQLCLRCACVDMLIKSQARHNIPLNSAASFSAPIGLDMASNQRADDWETERTYASSQHGPWLARDCGAMRELLEQDELAALYDRIKGGLTKFEGWCLRMRLKGWSAAKIAKAHARQSGKSFKAAYKAVDNASGRVRTKCYKGTIDLEEILHGRHGHGRACASVQANGRKRHPERHAGHVEPAGVHSAGRGPGRDGGEGNDHAEAPRQEGQAEASR